jgi:hypothetical protein
MRVGVALVKADYSLSLLIMGTYFGCEPTNKTSSTPPETLHPSPLVGLDEQQIFQDPPWCIPARNLRNSTQDSPFLTQLTGETAFQLSS